MQLDNYEQLAEQLDSGPEHEPVYAPSPCPHIPARACSRLAGMRSTLILHLKHEKQEHLACESDAANT